MHLDILNKVAFWIIISTDLTFAANLRSSTPVRLPVGIAGTEVTCRQIEDFLGVRLPADLNISTTDNVRLLHNDQIDQLTVERAPFFFIDRAIAVNNSTVWAATTMTEERSAGHFPGRPIVPLIELCKATAQAGIILTALQGQTSQAPIAISAGESKALAKELIDAPVRILICVKLTQSRMRLHFVDGVTYVEGIKVGSLNRIVYTLVERTQIIAKGNGR
jgi:3-hydroxymyristoyl/3-hydroxydecanoyl-(acyl carrier protein) dehydratase